MPLSPCFAYQQPFIDGLMVSNFIMGSVVGGVQTCLTAATVWTQIYYFAIWNY